MLLISKETKPSWNSSTTKMTVPAVATLDHMSPQKVSSDSISPITNKKHLLWSSNNCNTKSSKQRRKSPVCQWANNNCNKILNLSQFLLKTGSKIWKLSILRMKILMNCRFLSMREISAAYSMKKSFLCMISTKRKNSIMINSVKKLNYYNIKIKKVLMVKNHRFLKAGNRSRDKKCQTCHNQWEKTSKTNTFRNMVMNTKDNQDRFQWIAKIQSMRKILFW